MSNHRAHDNGGDSDYRRAHQVLIIEDEDDDAAFIRRSLKGAKAFANRPFEPEFWGSKGEAFDVAAIKARLKDRGRPVSTVVLDNCWSRQEVQSFAAMDKLSFAEIERVPLANAPGAVRLMREIRADPELQDFDVPVLVWTWHVHNAWTAYLKERLRVHELVHKCEDNVRMLPVTLDGMDRRRRQRNRLALKGIVGESAATRHLRAQIVEVVNSLSNPVLILGPAGSGKTKVARIIGQALSPFGEFGELTCPNLPDDAIDPTLFGSVGGIFANNPNGNRGRFRHCDGGSLFLDEIADLPLPSQGKLLKAVEDNIIEPVGDDESTRVNVRVIAATDKDLVAEVAADRFRSQLYDRFKRGHVIRIPTLRERREELPALAQDILDEVLEREAQPYKHFSATAIDFLVREFEQQSAQARQLVEVISGGTRKARGHEITADHLKEAMVEKSLAVGQSDAARGNAIPDAPFDLLGDYHAQHKEADRIFYMRWDAALLKFGGNDKKARKFCGVDKSKYDEFRYLLDQRSKKLGMH